MIGRLPLACILIKMLISIPSSKGFLSGGCQWLEQCECSSGMVNINCIGISDPTKFTEIEENIQNVSRIVSLDLKQYKIVELKDYWLDSKEINRLVLSHNGIEIIHDRAFSGISNLKEIDLSSNRILYLNPILQSLSINKYLDYSFTNGLVSLDLSSNTFRDNFMNITNNLRSLDILTINYNAYIRIFRLSANVIRLQNLKKLIIAEEGFPVYIFFNITINIYIRNIRELNLRNGLVNNLIISMEHLREIRVTRMLFSGFIQLRNMPTLIDLIVSQNLGLNFSVSNVFLNLVNLKNLHLNDNQLRFLNRYLFRSLSNLELLDLSKNELDYMDIELFDPLTRLKSLNLQFNKLHKIQNFQFRHLNNLIELTLSHNRLRFFESDSLNGLGNLKIIHLKNNDDLDLMQNNSFQNLKSLTNLDLEAYGLKSLQNIIVKNFDKIETLSLSRNLLQSLECNLISIMKNLKSLVISFNILRTIDKYCFSDLTELTELKLDSNYLSHIHQEWFMDTIKLKILSLMSNLIKTIPDNCFNNLNNLEGLYLSSNRISDLQRNSFYGLDNLKVLILESNKLDVKSYHFQSLISLKFLVWGFHVRNVIQKLNKFPSLELNNLDNLDTFLHDLSKTNIELFNLTKFKIFNIQNSRLEYVHPNIFINFKSLTNLKLKSNQIKEIHKDTFDDFHSLERLNLNENYISQLTFKNLSSLDHLFLDNNNLINLDFITPYNLPNLIHLSIKSNQLTVVNQNLKYLTKLQNVIFSYNKIKIIEKYALLNIYSFTFESNEYGFLRHVSFDNLFKNEIQSIHITNNRVEEFISNKSWYYLNTLTLRNCEFNMLARIDFSFIPYVESLDISGSLLNFSNIYNFDKLSRLKNLKMSNVGLESLESISFKNLFRLIHLNLSYNKIKSIYHEHFSNQIQLQFLDLSNNMLEDNLRSIFHLNRISIINLQNNFIPDIRPNTFLIKPYLTNLNLHNNRLNSSKEIFINENLRTIDLSSNELSSLELKKDFIKISSLIIFNAKNNRLTHIDPDYFKNNWQIHDLNLGYNQLNELDENLFHDQYRLMNLSLNNNKLSSIDERLFENLLSLRILDLSYNKISHINQDMFKNLRSLLELDLSSNNLLAIYLNDLFALKSLNLNNNDNLIISTKSFENVNSLNIHIPMRTVISRNNKVNLVESLKPKLFKNNELLTYYEAIYIVSDDIADNLNNTKIIDSYCKLVIYFITNNLHFNLRSTNDFDLFIEKCVSFELVSKIVF